MDKTRVHGEVATAAKRMGDVTHVALSVRQDLEHCYQALPALEVFLPWDTLSQCITELEQIADQLRKLNNGAAALWSQVGEGK